MMWIDEFDELSTRAINVLRENNVASPEEALKLGYIGLIKLRACGRRTAREIIGALSEGGGRERAQRAWRSMLRDVPSDLLLNELERRNVVERQVVLRLKKRA